MREIENPEAAIDGVMAPRVGPLGSGWGGEWRHDGHGGRDGEDWRDVSAW